MKNVPLAEAKAHISELVDRAEHHGARTIILRHGKPAAAIVPVAVAKPVPRPPPRALTERAARAARRSVAAFIDAFSECEPDVSAVLDLRNSRR